MRNVRALISYDGSRYHGWQRQDGFPTIQQSLEDALELLLSTKTTVHGSGRTDTGVHALGQVAHFHVDTHLSDDRLRHALNFHVGPAIVLRRVETCRADFHARFDARAKRYAYLVSTTRFRPAFGQTYSHWVSAPLDLPAMRAAARELVGRHDFSSFATAGSPRENNVRTLNALHFVARRDRLAFVVQGDGFLYNMVRTIAGTLIQVGKHRLAPADVGRILAARDRTHAGPTAPPDGLYLVAVRYAETLFPGRDRGGRGAPGVFHY